MVPFLRFHWEVRSLLPRCPGPDAAFACFCLFNHNQPPPRGLLFLEGDSGAAVGLTDSKSNATLPLDVGLADARSFHGAAGR